jgi:hypothetical protein
MKGELGPAGKAGGMSGEGRHVWGMSWAVRSMLWPHVKVTFASIICVFPKLAYMCGELMVLNPLFTTCSAVCHVSMSK